VTYFPLAVRRLLLPLSMHRSAWKRNSANFAVTEFYEVRKESCKK
jgi:hypothetical protein